MLQASHPGHPSPARTPFFPVLSIPQDNLSGPPSAPPKPTPDSLSRSLSRPYHLSRRNTFFALLFTYAGATTIRGSSGVTGTELAFFVLAYLRAITE